MWRYIVFYAFVDNKRLESGNGVGLCESSLFPQCNVLGRLDLMLRHSRDVHPTWVQSLVSLTLRSLVRVLSPTRTQRVSGEMRQRLSQLGFIDNAQRGESEQGNKRVIKSLVLYRRIQEVKSEALGAKDCCTYRLQEQQRHYNNRCHLDNGVTQDNRSQRTIESQEQQTSQTSQEQ